MSPVIKSGAFLQQCFSSHPLCLDVKRVNAAARVVLKCTSCNLLHGLTLQALECLDVQRTDEEGPSENQQKAEESLVACVTRHAPALRVREMDVLKNAVGLRCVECRRVFNLDVLEFETQQR